MMGNDSEHDGFKVGEDVIGYHNREHVRGKVTKVTSARVTVAWADGRTDVLHRRKWGRPFECKRVTAEDLAREAWKAEIMAWKAARPTPAYLAIRFPYGDARVTADCDATLDSMRQIADEAEAISEWLRKRPEEPR